MPNSDIRPGEVRQHRRRSEDELFCQLDRGCKERLAYTEPNSGSDGRITITRFTHCRSSCTAYHVSGILFIVLCSHRRDVADLPMKTVHPVQSVLPSEPRPPARTGIDNSAPMMNVAVTKVTESEE